MVFAVTEPLVASKIDDNDASGAVSATLMIARFSRSVIYLGHRFLLDAVWGHGSPIPTNII